MRTTAIAALAIAVIAGACSASASAPTWTFAPGTEADTAALTSGQAAADQAASPSTSLAPSASAAPSTGALGTIAGTAPAPAGGATTGAAPDEASVQIANFAFGPETVTIQPGGTVTWTNADGDRHSVLIGGSESGRLEQGGTFSRSFPEAGTFAYVCGLHASMNGTIVVLAAGSAASAWIGPDGERHATSGTSSPDATAAPSAAPTSRPDCQPGRWRR